MRDYFKDLDKIIKRPQDILLCDRLISEISHDKIFIRSLINDFLTAMTTDLSLTDKKVSSNVLLLKSIAQQSDNKIYLPAITYHDAGQASSIVNHSIYSVLTPLNSEVTVDQYLLPENWRGDVFDPSMKLSFDKTIILQPGDVLKITPSKKCCHFKFKSKTLFLKIQSQEMFEPFEWSFDSQKLNAWQCIATEPKDSYAHHLCMAAASIADDRFIAPLHSMLQHDKHYVRWSAAQALGAISYVAGEVAMRKLSSDPHPHIVNAAQHMLKHIDQGHINGN